MTVSRLLPFLLVVLLHAVGLVMGVAFGVFTRLCLRFMRYLGASHDQEVALTLGVAYLAYWITAQPCKGSGERASEVCSFKHRRQMFQQCCCCDMPCAVEVCQFVYAGGMFCCRSMVHEPHKSQLCIIMVCRCGSCGSDGPVWCGDKLLGHEYSCTQSL